jgi:large subunit ribosomal protein L4
VRIGALRSALSKFHKEGRLVVVDRFELAEIKTKGVLQALGALKTERHTLVVDTAANENLRLSIRNSKDHQFLPPEGVNVYDLLRHDTLVLSKDAAKVLESRCLSKGDGAAEKTTKSAKKAGAK